MGLLNRIEELEKELLELKELVKEEQEFPQVGDTHWYINTYGAVSEDIWEEHVSEKNMIKIGNVFRTEQEAEFAAEKLRVEAELRKFGKRFESWKCNFTIGLDHFYEELTIESMGLTKLQGVIYFESEEKTRQAIETVGADRIKKYIFGVEE